MNEEIQERLSIEDMIRSVESAESLGDASLDYALQKVNSRRVCRQLGFPRWFQLASSVLKLAGSYSDSDEVLPLALAYQCAAKLFLHGQETSVISYTDRRKEALTLLDKAVALCADSDSDKVKIKRGYLSHEIASVLEPPEHLQLSPVARGRISHFHIACQDAMENIDLRNPKDTSSRYWSLGWSKWLLAQTRPLGDAVHYLESGRGDMADASTFDNSSSTIIYRFRRIRYLVRGLESSDMDRRNLYLYQMHASLFLTSVIEYVLETLSLPYVLKSVQGFVLDLPEGMRVKPLSELESLAQATGCPEVIDTVSSIEKSFSGFVAEKDPIVPDSFLDLLISGGHSAYQKSVASLDDSTHNNLQNYLGDLSKKASWKLKWTGIYHAVEGYRHSDPMFFDAVLSYLANQAMDAFFQTADPWFAKSAYAVVNEISQFQQKDSRADLLKPKKSFAARYMFVSTGDEAYAHECIELQLQYIMDLRPLDSKSRKKRSAFNCAVRHFADHMIFFRASGVKFDDPVLQDIVDSGNPEEYIHWSKSL